MTDIARAALIAAALASAMLGAGAMRLEASDGPCPALLRSATRLLLVVSADMAANEATARRFERASSQSPWREVHAARSLTLGRHGLGWAWNQKDLAEEGEPIKVEGDRRTPAGAFEIGSAFGFAAQGPGASYLALKERKAFCVNDVGSSRYNEIIARESAAPGVSGEAMSEISLYRRGLKVNYPTSREQRGGSCIFIHVWRGPHSPTLGCLAFGENEVEDLQRWAGEAPSVVAILPRQALERLQACLPQPKSLTPAE